MAGANALPAGLPGVLITRVQPAISTLAAPLPRRGSSMPRSPAKDADARMAHQRTDMLQAQARLAPIVEDRVFGTTRKPQGLRRRALGNAPCPRG